MKWILPLFALLFLFLPACRKEKTTLSVFRELTVPVEDDLSAVWFTDDLNGAATGGTPWQRGFILSTRDGGDHWAVDTLLQRKMECVMFDSSGQGYACGQDIALSLPQGEGHWLNFRTQYQWARACYFPDSRQGVIVYGESYRRGSADLLGPEFYWKSDTTFEFPNELASVWYSDARTVHAVGIGWVMRSEDGGRHWQRLDITGDFFTRVQFPTPQTGYICGSSGAILKTTDAGLSWQNIRKGGSTGKRHQPFRALWFSTADEGWLVGDNGLFWYTGNGGLDWTPVADAPGQIDFTGIFVRNNRGWITAKGGRMYYFER